MATRKKSTPATGRGSIDDYLAGLDPAPRAALEQLRRTIAAAAPDAEEGWSYGVPAFRLGGRPLAAFAAAAKHCSYFPMSGAVIAAHAEELDGYDTSKGTIRFAADAGLPASLVRKLVAARRAELERGARRPKR
jgi:uncharacterized protein YdhG (YjbR/CyaY superfamily)